MCLSGLLTGLVIDSGDGVTHVVTYWLSHVLPYLQEEKILTLQEIHNNPKQSDLILNCFSVWLKI